eukprot:TRINITY_DN63977_c0_g1_i1.p1 TRINITY_DN63977_c0_g1~~TRINITY_DN63977_c0_g1_i1.p1  ORF type:complete len:187 (-),score=23.05 TRINITY_DN63977_c0_g1_i1:93-653(-)
MAAGATADLRCLVEGERVRALADIDRIGTMIGGGKFPPVPSGTEGFVRFQDGPDAVSVGWFLDGEPLITRCRHEDLAYVPPPIGEYLVHENTVVRKSLEKGEKQGSLLSGAVVRVVGLRDHGNSLHGRIEHPYKGWLPLLLRSDGAGHRRMASPVEELDDDLRETLDGNGQRLGGLVAFLQSRRVP